MINQNIPQLSFLSNAPSAPSEGDTWYDESTNTINVFVNGYWNSLSLDHKTILDIKYGNIKYILYIDDGDLFLNVIDSEGENIITNVNEIFEELSNILNNDALIKIEKEIFKEI
ncbi:MAG: hypothetical protein K9H48_07630 [Melioribacteraceae bacterium]|nr:hypothetical protein [Melioribacteraceae bacterium]